MSRVDQAKAADDADGRVRAGRCACGAARFRMHGDPLFVHACHCRWCQRETGSAFAVNALVERARLAIEGVAPDMVRTPSESGRGQTIARCPRCHVALWSHYSGLGEAVAFVRVGTLDAPDTLPPDIHIYTATKQPWVVLPDDTPAVEAYYDRAKVWPKRSLDRLAAL